MVILLIKSMVAYM
jgi:ectoine hydroxylase-related dioxygenase (phytanoyl-CoA dioxygenase family)